MGKRKERRLAALTNTGRRVKLDLFAEPSGELGGSNVHGDAGGDTDSQQRDGLPNSPSSSGPKSQNPLLLLGQYSDDEVDEGSSEGPNDPKVHSHEEAKGEVSKDLDTSVSADPVAEENGQQNTMQDSTPLDVEYNEKNKDDVAPGDLQNEMASQDQMYASEGFDERVGTDISSGWKMVMHEESQRYYYWNIETGETSWEVPQVLAQADQLTNDLLPPASADDKIDSAAVGMDSSNMISAAMLDTSATLVIDGSVESSATYKELHGHGFQMNECNGERSHENPGSSVNGNELTRDDGHMSLSYGGDHSIVSKVSVEERQVDMDFPCRLVEQSESLLEKLKSLKKSEGDLQGLDCWSKYMLELEIRLSDLRSLASYGPSLLPFWLHSEGKIKLLESSINDDLLQIYKSALDEVEDKQVSVFEGLGDKQVPVFEGLGDKQVSVFEALGELQNDVVHESEVDQKENKGNFLTSEDSNRCQADALVVLNNANDKISPNAQDNPLAISTGGGHMETGLVVNTETEATTNLEEFNHKHGYDTREDDDMDVDMEIEDMNSSRNTTLVDMSVAKDFVQTDQPVQSNPLNEYHSLLPEDEFVVPPPPDDEWIPPPPPDNEQAPPLPPPEDDQMPPPPPGDSLAPSYHVLQSYAETGQPISFAQYNISYPGASSEYYEHTAAEVPSSNIYGQIAMPPAQLYYSAIPHIYNESSQVMINPTDSVAYYEVQDGASSNPTPDINTIDSGVVGGPDRASADVPSTSTSIHAPATVSVDGSISLPVATTEAAADRTTSSVAAKGQTKVVRSKKRAVAVGSSLKSNKKVSSMVDKWKAAKEELLEEDEEPESVYEVLERKRQREIEEWKAKQIASGEAKDNANFQPLGGDWRERVRRKRARAARETTGAAQDTIEHNQKQPDLVELCKGLPSNWQAYWDEASKKVYYGNLITSETTWTRPTK